MYICILTCGLIPCTFLGNRNFLVFIKISLEFLAHSSSQQLETWKRYLLLYQSTTQYTWIVSNNGELSMSMIIKFNQTFVKCPQHDLTFNQLISLFFSHSTSLARAPFMSLFAWRALGRWGGQIRNARVPNRTYSPRNGPLVLLVLWVYCVKVKIQFHFDVMDAAMCERT